MASSATFDKMVCVSDPTAAPSALTANRGPLEVDQHGLTFAGKRPISISDPLSVGRVHSGAWANDLIRVDFAEGDSIASLYFVVGKRGKAAREATDRLHGLLSAMVEKGQAEGAVSPDRAQALERHREALAEQARTGDTGRRWTIGLGVILIVGGIIATVVSISAASDTGGTSYFFYGAIFVGIGLVVRGFLQRTREGGS
jgi:hypothetical protein